MTCRQVNRFGGARRQMSFAFVYAQEYQDESDDPMTWHQKDDEATADNAELGKVAKPFCRQQPFEPSQQPLDLSTEQDISGELLLNPHVFLTCTTESRSFMCLCTGRIV